MDITRIAVTSLKTGDLIQGNVTDLKQLEQHWYEVESVERTAKDITLKVSIVRFSNGVKSEKQGTFTQSFNPRTIVIKKVTQ